jgi:hypothetical protein
MPTATIGKWEVMTATAARATSLWLVPAEPHRAELRARIDRLALEHGAPAFEPHVTLVTGDLAPDAVAVAIERVAARWAPLDVVAGCTAHGPDRFQAVFVELADRRLADLARALSEALELRFEPAALQPHLSLLYAAHLPVPVRAAIAREHDLAGRSFRFDTLLASVPAADADDVARWQSPVIRALTGAEGGDGTVTAGGAGP